MRLTRHLSLALMLFAAACSTSKGGGATPDDGDAGQQDAGAESHADAGGQTEDASSSGASPNDGGSNSVDGASAKSRLPEPGLDRPPQGGLPSDLRPPR